MTITETPIKNIIRKLLKGEDYRIEVITLINTTFLQYTIEFFKKIVDAKLKNQNITVDWYKKEFLDPALPSEELIINSGLNKKTITNMFNTARREVVLDAVNEHYDELYSAIKELIKNENEINITLTIKFNNVSVDLDVSESLIVINTLAVKRAQVRGGYWSTAGKKVEGPLMLTLCKLFKVPEDFYKAKITQRIQLTEEELEKNIFAREIDFYLLNADGEKKCEVKLMGKGNPESADAFIARDSQVFIADKLSDTNKRQLNSRSVEWVELRSKEGYRKFKEVLDKLGIPHEDVPNKIEKELNLIFSEILASRN